MKYFSILALATGSLVSAGALNKNFTVNLLTRDESISIIKLDLDNQTPISFNDAVIKHVYDNIVFSVVGSMVFTESEAVQKFHLDTDQWSVDIEMSLLNAGDDTIMHQDVEIGKNPSQSSEFWWDQLPDKIPGVDFRMDQNNRADKPTE